MNQIFSAKDPDEAIVYSFDFTKLLDPSETITECAFTVLDMATNSVVTEMLQDDVDISEAPVVKHWIKGGKQKRDYLVKASVTTSANRVLVGSAKLPVRIGA